MISSSKRRPRGFLQSRIEELIFITDVEPSAVYSIIPAFLWAILLCFLPIFNVDPIYHSFAERAPQWVWASIYIILGLWQSLTLIYGKHTANLYSYFAGIIVWTMTGILTSNHAYHLGLFPVSPEPYIYWLAAGGCAWAAGRKLLMHLIDWTAKVESMQTKIRQEVRHAPLD